MNFSFLGSPFVFACFLPQKWNGMVGELTWTHISPAGFLKKREDRVTETAVDTRLGLGQVRSGSNISINLGFTTVLFVMLLILSRNA
jgi:hypothetical protein